MGLKGLVVNNAPRSLEFDVETTPSCTPHALLRPLPIQYGGSPGPQPWKGEARAKGTKEIASQSLLHLCDVNFEEERSYI